MTVYASKSQDRAPGRDGEQVPPVDYGHSDVIDDERGPDTRPPTWLERPRPARTPRMAELAAHLRWIAGSWVYPAGNIGHWEQD